MKIFRYLSHLVFSLCLLFASSAYAFPPAFSSSTATQFDALTDVAGEGTIHYVLTDDGDGTYTMKLLTADNFAATLDLSGKTITFGLEASDIPDLSGTYQPLQAYLTDIAALSMVAGDILYFDGTDIVKLGEGSNDGYVLAINTATHAPYWKQDADTGGATAWDDITNPDANDEIDFTTYTIEFSFDNGGLVQFGDGGGTNYVQITHAGAMTFGGTGDIDLPADSVDAADLNFNYAASASEGGAATTLTVSDNESTNENNAILFTSGGDLDGGNLGIESDGDLYYNPSTGLLYAAGGFSSAASADPYIFLNESDGTDVYIQNDDTGDEVELSTDSTASSNVFFKVGIASGDVTLGGTSGAVVFKDQDASPDAVGEFFYDNTVAGITDGALCWYDDDAVRYLVDLATLPSDDDYVVAYDADADQFYMKADSTGAGGDQLVDVVTTAPLTINATTHVDNILPGSDADITFAIGDAAADGSTKGAAAFTASHFDTASGVVSLDTTNGPDAFLDNCLLSPTGGTWDLSSITLTLPSYDTTPVANPAMTLYDSGAPGSELADKMVARIYAEYIDGAEDSENSDVGFQAMQDGSWVTFLFFDESDDQVEVPKNLSLAGDLTITGDDIFATTNTAGYIWVGDDTNYNPVAVSGDISLGSNGATAVQDDAVQPDDIEYIVETEYLPIGYAIDGGTAPATKETITSTHKADVRKFDGSAQDEDVYFTWQAPDDLDTTSGIKFRVLCMVTEATAPSTETWQFEMQGFSAGSGDALAGTLGTAQTSNSGSRSDARYDFVYTAWSSAMTSTHITDLAAGEAVTFKLYRDIDDTDTYAQDVGVIGVQLRYKRNPVTTF